MCTSLMSICTCITVWHQVMDAVNKDIVGFLQCATRCACNAHASRGRDSFSSFQITNSCIASRRAWKGSQVVLCSYLLRAVCADGEQQQNAPSLRQ